MSRLALFAAAAVLAAGAAQAQRVDVDPNRWTLSKPVDVHPGELVAGEISPVDIISGVERSGDVLTFQARAGETITAQVRSDVPSLLVAIRSARPGMRLSPLLEGPARDAPIRFVAPKDDTYQIYVHTQGPNRYGKYLLSIGTDQGAPSFDPPKPIPAPVQLAEAPKPVAAPPRPAGPAEPPPLPKIPGVINARTGQTISRPAAKPGAATEMYQFLAAGGSDLQVNLTGAGPLALRLYTSGGEEILATTGDAILRLDAIAPIDDLYFLSVSRADGTKPYRLNLVETPVDALSAVSRYAVGYEELDESGKVARSACWLQPGVKLRRTFAGGVTGIVTLLADGRARSENSAPGRPSATIEWTTRLEGDVAVLTFASGAANRRPVFTERLGAYRGYLCK